MAPTPLPSSLTTPSSSPSYGRKRPEARPVRSLIRDHLPEHQWRGRNRYTQCLLQTVDRQCAGSIWDVRRQHQCSCCEFGSANRDPPFHYRISNPGWRLHDRPLRLRASRHERHGCLGHKWRTGLYRKLKGPEPEAHFFCVETSRRLEHTLHRVADVGRGHRNPHPHLAEDFDLFGGALAEGRDDGAGMSHLAALGC